MCTFKGIAPGTSCCTPQGTILNPLFSCVKEQEKYEKNKGTKQN